MALAPYYSNNEISTAVLIEETWFFLICKPLESDTLYLRYLTFCLQDCCHDKLSLLFLQFHFDVNFTCFSVWESWGRQKFRTYFSNLHKNNFYLKIPESLYIIFSSNIWIIKTFFNVMKDATIEFQSTESPLTSLFIFYYFHLESWSVVSRLKPMSWLWADERAVSLRERKHGRPIRKRKLLQIHQSYDTFVAFLIQCFSCAQYWP